MHTFPDGHSNMRDGGPAEFLHLIIPPAVKLIEAVHLLACRTDKLWKNSDNNHENILYCGLLSDFLPSEDK